MYKKWLVAFIPQAIFYFGRYEDTKKRVVLPFFNQGSSRVSRASFGGRIFVSLLD